MNKQKGFTLIEILAVVVVIAVVLTITIPTVFGVIESSKQKAYDIEVGSIVSATKNYVAANVKTIAALKTVGVGYDITLEQLGATGFIDMPVKNPLTNRNFNGTTTFVTVELQANGSFSYVFDTGAANAPELIPVGDNPDTIACNSSGNYTDLGADVDDPIHPSAANVYSASTLPLSDGGTYSLPYTYTNAENVTATANRTIVITNTNVPTISVTGNPTSITFVAGTSFSPPSATANDTCEGSLDVTIVSDVNSNIAGDYTITYTATNKGGTTKVKTIPVTVTGNRPTLTLNGDNPDTVACASTGNYSDPGAEVTDPLDEDAEDVYANALSRKYAGEYPLSYNYTSPVSGKKAISISRTVTITNTNTPVINITGGTNDMTIVKNSSFTARSATASDPCEGSLDVDVVSTVNVTTAGHYTVTYTATNSANNYDQDIIYVHVVEQYYTFSYTGNYQTFSTPGPGIWKIELWGAEGGCPAVSGIYGGKGAYAKGNITLGLYAPIYIYVGGHGDAGSGSSPIAGGWNGGGSGGKGTTRQGGSGGGATDVREGGYTLSDRILIAGAGGGGNSYSRSYGDGGYGGGSAAAGNGTYTVGTYSGYGGTQSAGGNGGTTATAGTAGSSGTGGNGGYYSTTYGSGGGGAGYYGGGGGAERRGAGGGGSSWYDTGVISSATLTAGNATMPTWDGQGTMTGNGSGTTTELNGYAKITFISEM